MEKQSKKDRLAQYKQRTITGGVAAVKNTANGKILLISAVDLHGCRNRFEFSQKMGGCMHMQLQDDWKKYGTEVFSFEVLEQLEKKDTQTAEEFSDDIKTLEQLWREKLASDRLY